MTWLVARASTADTRSEIEAILMLIKIETFGDWTSCTVLLSILVREWEIEYGEPVFIYELKISMES